MLKFLLTDWQTVITIGYPPKWRGHFDYQYDHCKHLTYKIYWNLIPEVRHCLGDGCFQGIINHGCYIHTLSIDILSLCRGHSWRVRLAKQETLTPSRAPGLTSGLQGSVNVQRGAILLVLQWQCISSYVFYIVIECSQSTRTKLPQYIKCCRGNLDLMGSGADLEGVSGWGGRGKPPTPLNFQNIHLVAQYLTFQDFLHYQYFCMRISKISGSLRSPVIISN